MSSSQDRVRRILADHGPAVRPASELPPSTRSARPGPSAPAAHSASADPAAPRTPPPDDASATLRARLEALRAGLSTHAPAPAAAAGVAPLVLPDDDDDRTLEERVGGSVRAGRKGSFLLVERRHVLAEPHGSWPLSHAFERAIPLRRRERRPGGAAAVHPRDAVFLDVETTGLSGGTGTIAFLVGTARVDGDSLVVRQYFVRDFPDEPAVLEALADDLGDAPLVTFNGRSFDAPLLSTRFRLHRIPFADRDHLDLLPPARRLWAGSLESHALSSLERGVLGVARTEDLPGALVPAAYFAWLRDGRSLALSLAFRHNEVDLVSLVSLAGVVSRLLDDPAGRRDAPARDHLDTARLLLDLGDAAKAKACLAAAADAGGEVPAAVRRLLGAIQRREGDFDGALRTWSAWLACAGPFDAHPYEEVAKHLEHRRKDARAALAVVTEALTRCPPADRHRAALAHRAARLQSRLARR